MDELGIVLRRYWVGSWDCKVCGFTNHRDDPDTCVLCYSPRRPTKRAVELATAAPKLEAAHKKSIGKRKGSA